MTNKSGVASENVGQKKNNSSFHTGTSQNNIASRGANNSVGRDKSVNQREIHHQRVISNGPHIGGQGPPHLN